MRKVLALALSLTLSGCSSPTSERVVPPQEIPDLTDANWIERTAEATGIPERAVQAYAQASVALPECGIGWNTLAAIGATESGHGSHDGATIGSDGVVSPKIIGIALDGGESVAAVPDTDGWYSAILAYNASEEYAAVVAERAARYVE